MRGRGDARKDLKDLINSVNGLIRNPTRLAQLGKICEKFGISLINPVPLTYNSG